MPFDLPKLEDKRLYEGRVYVCWYVTSDACACAKTVEAPFRYTTFNARQWAALPVALEVACA